MHFVFCSRTQLSSAFSSPCCHWYSCSCHGRGWGCPCPSWSFYLSWVDASHKGRDASLQLRAWGLYQLLMELLLPHSQWRSFDSHFPNSKSCLGWVLVGLDWMDRMNCTVHEILNYGSLQKVAWKFFLLLLPHTPTALESRTTCSVSSWAQGQHSCSILCFQASPSQETGRAPSEEAGGRWLGAQRHWEEHASISSTSKPSLSRQILHSSQSFHAFPQGKSRAVPGRVHPPGKDALGPAGSSGEWLLVHLCQESSRALCRGGSGGHDAGEPLLQAQWEHGGSMLSIFCVS